jgi:formate dehydrogenase subunit gamma
VAATHNRGPGPSGSGPRAAALPGRRRTTSGGTADNARRVLRFDRTERALHWVTAVLFGIVMATGLALYFPSVAAIFGRRELIERIHLWDGLALPVPLLVAVVGPWGARLRADLRRINFWSRGEVRRLFSLGRRGPETVDKFNPGQKANAIFIGSAMAVMLASGAVLQWFRFFPLDWRTGSTLVHDLGALAVFAVVTGHIAFALTHPDALRSMVRGWVTEAWARRHASAWLQGVREEERLGREGPVPRSGRPVRTTINRR